MSRTGAMRVLAALALAIGALAATSASAGAQDTAFNCDASALRVTLLGQATIEPVTANRGAAQCANASNTLTLPAPLASTVANALTQITSDNQKANAAGGVGGLAVSPAALAPLTQALQSAVAAAQAGAQPAINAITPISIPVSSLTGLTPLQLLGLGGVTTITVDIRPALNALLGAIGSTNADLVNLDLATANAQAQCVANQPQLTGSSQLGALKVLGLTIPTDTATTQALNVINTQSIDPSKIDLSKIVIISPSSPLDPSVLSLVQSALGPLLAKIPPISIPAQLAQIAVTPNQQTRTADQLIEDALHVSVSLLGQNLIDAGLGEARVSNSSVNCAPPSPVTTAALQCATRKLTLINVVQHGNHVALLGAADRSLIGQRVAIYYLVGHRLVATPVVQPDGTFTARGPLPPASQRFTNLARYQAVDQAGEKSLDLKLHRRMVVDSTRVAGGNVTIAGRVLGPLTKPIAPVLIQRRVSCTKLVTVARLKPNPSTGAFKVTLPAPPNTQAAVYRAATQVLKVDTNPKQFPTFTLPNFVALP